MDDLELLHTMRTLLDGWRTAGIHGGWWCVTCQQFVGRDVPIFAVNYHRTPNGLHQIRRLEALQQVPDSWLTATSQATSATLAG